MDPRLETAVEVSRRWYEDIFALHGLSARTTTELWMAIDPPPRWHSVVKTLRPGVATDAVLTAMSSHEHGSVADSFGELALGSHRFKLLIDATWLYLAPRDRRDVALPSGWTVVEGEQLLSVWNREHGTDGVLLPRVLAHPRFTVLARHDGEALSAGAVLHDTGLAVGLSNTWSREAEFDWKGLLDVVAGVHPGQALVGYAAEAGPFTAAGFEPVGPQQVWERLDVTSL